MTKLYAMWMLVVAITLCAISAGAQTPAKETKADTKSESSKKAATPAAPEEKTSAPGETSARAKAKPARASKPKAASKSSNSATNAPEVTLPSGAAAPSSAPGAATSSAADAAASYVVRLRDLESRVDELKEQIRRSHTRLTLLSESILSAGVGGAQAQVVFRNSMSNAFRVEEVMVVLDGAVQYNEKGEEAPHRRQQVTPVFDGAIPPGDHTIQIVVNLRGHGYGVFSYLKGFSFEAKSTHSFTVRQGGAVRIEAIAFERGDATTPLEQKPALRFNERPLGAEEQAAGQ